MGKLRKNQPFSFSGFRKNLIKLTSLPGPSRLISRTLFLPGEPELPLYSAVKEIAQDLNKKENANLRLQSHNGNLVIVGGFKEQAFPPEKAIREIPFAFTAHLDEITFLISKVYDRKSPATRLLIPLCNPPKLTSDESKPAQIWRIQHGALELRGEGELKLSLKPPFKKEGIDEYKYRKEKDATVFYYIKAGCEVKEGDVVIYQPSDKPFNWRKNLFSTKALDDRAGVIATIYAMMELSKRGIKTKGILTCDEEGYPEDVAWARLVGETFRKFCKSEDAIIICDGVDGRYLLAEFLKYKNKHLDFPLIVPYTSHGKGGGDHLLFALLRDEIPRRVENMGYKVETTTAYVSRSIDPKLMDEFPHICFIDWVNGMIGQVEAVCHLKESVPLNQLENLVAALFCSGEYITDIYKK